MLLMCLIDSQQTWQEEFGYFAEEGANIRVWPEVQNYLKPHQHLVK